VERSSWPRHLSLCSRFIGWTPSRVLLRGEHAPATTRSEAAEAARDQLPWHVCHDALRCEECRAISLLLEEVVDYTGVTCIALPPDRLAQVTGWYAAARLDVGRADRAEARRSNGDLEHGRSTWMRQDADYGAGAATKAW
jgi:hypothetical protein